MLKKKNGVQLRGMEISQFYLLRPIEFIRVFTARNQIQIEIIFGYNDRMDGRQKKCYNFEKSRYQIVTFGYFTNRSPPNCVPIQFIFIQK